ncbi:MipA/OmpV family protein [Novosphingobium sp. 9]|uniref:MipA/OmpV family protein n=1 Tax=Novosphingobium sp. 9 TaxID=2025349 RepID=UPI0021B5CA20|nr:MipA/OmpV family protein [Novosphingobium sp. 9]
MRAAGKLDVGINVGGNAGVNFNKLLNPYDQLTVGADVLWDVNGASGGMQINPNVTYKTPVSKAALVILNVGARHVDDDYAKYYYSVNATQSANSGLPLYNAKGGWDSWHTAMIVGYDLSGDLRDGGFEVFLFGNYMRMLNDASATPYTSIRGSANNWTGGVGVGYTF